MIFTATGRCTAHDLASPSAAINRLTRISGSVGVRSHACEHVEVVVGAVDGATCIVPTDTLWAGDDTGHRPLRADAALIPISGDATTSALAAVEAPTSDPKVIVAADFDGLPVGQV